MLQTANRVLWGVGDIQRGQWSEAGHYAFHLRRRLTQAEESRIGPAIDIRGTPEANARMVKMTPYVPAGWVE